MSVIKIHIGGNMLTAMNVAEYFLYKANLEEEVEITPLK